VRFRPNPSGRGPKHSGGGPSHPFGWSGSTASSAPGSDQHPGATGSQSGLLSCLLAEEIGKQCVLLGDRILRPSVGKVALHDDSCTGHDVVESLDLLG
jgi:hypothetical protein